MPCLVEETCSVGTTACPQLTPCTSEETCAEGAATNPPLATFLSCAAEETSSESTTVNPASTLHLESSYAPNSIEKWKPDTVQHQHSSDEDMFEASSSEDLSTDEV